MTLAYRRSSMSAVPGDSRRLDILSGGRGVYTRPRLAELIKKGLRRALLVLEGPPGSGKTTAARDFFTTFTDSHRAAWVRLTDMHNHPDRFIMSVCRALRLAGVTNIQKNVRDKPDPRQVMHDIARAIKEARDDDKRNLALVLDDFQKLTSPVLWRNLKELVRLKVPGFTLMLISRERPPLLGEEIKGLYRILKPGDMEFTHEEAKGWLELNGMALSKEQVDALLKMSDARISRLYLYSASIFFPAENSADALGMAQDAAGGNELIGKVAIAAFSDDVRVFLLSVACLDEHRADICNAAAGRTDSEEMLKKAGGEGFLISRLGADEYAIHPLLLDYLRDLEQRENNERYVASLTRAADWYDKTGRLHQSAEHYARAGNYSKTAEVMLKICGGPEDIAFDANVYDLAEYRLRIGIIERIPIELIRAERPWLELQYILMLMMIGELRRAGQMIAAARQHYENLDASWKDSLLGEFDFISCMLVFGDIKKKGELFDRAYRRIGGPSRLFNRSIPVSLGTNQILINYYTGAKSIDEMREDYVAHWRRHNERVLGGMMNGMPQLLSGEVAYERGDCRAAVELGQEVLTDDVSPYAQLCAYFLLCRSDLAQGNFDGLRRWRSRGRELVEHSQKRLLTSSWELSRAFFASVTGNRQLVPWWLSDDGKSKIRYIGELIGIQSQMMAQALWYSSTGQIEKLEAVLPPLKEELQKGTVNLGLLYVKIYESVVSFKREGLDKAVKKLMAAYEQADPEGLVMPFVERSLSLHPMLQAALRGGASRDAKFQAWLERLERRMTQYNRMILKIKKRLGFLSLPLSAREAEVREMMLCGHTSGEICAILDISIENFNAVCHRVRKKTAVAEEGVMGI